MRNKQCEALLSNEAIMNSLNATNYDLVLADPSVPCGELLAAKEWLLHILTIRNLKEDFLGSP